MPKDKVVISFGRYNPPTLGHKKLFDAMFQLAKKENADMKIFSSHTQDKKKNPLSYDDKIKFLKLSFPNYKNNVVISDARTIFDVLKELAESGYKTIILVAGSDRAKEFQKVIKPYINTDHPDSIQLDSFKTANAGDRDPDSDDAVEAMSASKLREFARLGDIKNFSKGVSNTLSKEAVGSLFNLIRKGMEINNSEELHMKEEVKPGFDPAGNPSRLWQTFRKWFYIDEEGDIKKEDKATQPDGDFLVIDKKSGERHLPVKVNGKPDHRLMGAAYASLTKGFRGNRYEGPNKGDAMNKLKSLYKKEKMELPKD